MSPHHTCSRFWAHLRDFRRFQELFKIRHLPGLGRLTLVICVIMTRDSAPPPLAKPRRGLIFQGFSAAVPFSHSFTSSLQPSLLCIPPPLKNQIQDFTRLSIKLLHISHFRMFNYNSAEMQMIVRSDFALFASIVLSGAFCASWRCSFISECQK